jgi:AAA15 family ATPase/GTPase
MIATFGIKNYRSILDMSVGLRFAEGKAPNGYMTWDTLPFLEAPKGERLIPCLALFGANASGKTNVIRALATLQRAVLGKAVECYEPNKLHDDKGGTVFEMTLFIGDDAFVYTLDYNGTEIRHERLLKNGKSLYAVTHLKGDFSKQVRAENYTVDRLQSILDVECSDGNGRQIFTLLKRVGENYKGLNSDLLNVFRYIKTKLLVLQDNNIPLPTSVENLKEYYDGDREKALGAIVDLIRKLDVDIKNIEIKREEVDKSKGRPVNVIYRELPDNSHYEVIDIKSHHANVHGEIVQFDFIAEESEGTLRLAGLIGGMLFALKGGHILVVDELDGSLHSLLLRELLRLFKDKRYNTKGAQLVFTTHNTDILDDDILRVSEVAIIRKTLHSGSMIKRIVDFKAEGRDVRNVTNFRKQYLEGFYSGVPHPAI